MTATAHIPQQASLEAVGKVRLRAETDFIAFTVTILVILALYLPLQNPYWVPGGDSEVYTSAARSLVLTGKFYFNGLPVSMVPPGWSFVLAGLMKIWPAFLLLKLATMTCMTGSLAINFWICRRFWYQQ